MKDSRLSFVLLSSNLVLNFEIFCACASGVSAVLVPVVVAVRMNILSDLGVEAVLVPVVVAGRTKISSDLSEGVGVVLSFV